MIRICRLLIVLALLTLTATSSVDAQRNMQDVEIKTTDLGNGLYMLVGRGGNIGVSTGEDGVILIDDQYAELSEKILTAVAEISDKPLRYVINTHFHGDHSGGNEKMSEAGAVVVAHENVRKRMKKGIVRPGNLVVKPRPEGALPVITFSQSVTFHLNSQEARVIHLPNAHTNGDAVIYFPEANVIHMGDLLFNGMYPFIDMQAGGHLNGMIAAQEHALELVDEATKIIPGHGPLADKAALKRSHDMLVEVRRRVQALIDEGKSEDEAVAADPLKDFNEEWSTEFDNGEDIVRYAYQSLKMDD